MRVEQGIGRDAGLLGPKSVALGRESAALGGEHPGFAPNLLTIVYIFQPFVYKQPPYGGVTALNFLKKLARLTAALRSGACDSEGRTQLSATVLETETVTRQKENL